MSKTGYKYQIETNLVKLGWEVNQIDSSSVWWDDEHWKVQLKYDSNIYFYVYFLVDPLLESNNKKKQRISEIKATYGHLKDWNDNNQVISTICMMRGKFNEKLKEFLEDVTYLQRRKTTANN